MRIKSALLLAALAVCLPAHVALAQWTSVGNGIEYQQFSISGPNEVFVTRMDRTNTNAFLESSIGQGRTSGGTETVPNQAARYDDAIGYWGQTWGTRNDVVVAINGSYYNTTTGVPESGLVHSGWYDKRYDNLGGWSGFMWDLNRVPSMGLCVSHYSWKQLVTYETTNTQEFKGINVAPADGQLTIFTPQYDTSTGTGSTVSEVLVEMTTPFLIMPTPNYVTGYVRQIRQNQGNTSIPFDHIVLSALGTAETTLLGNVSLGDEIHISQEIKHYMTDCSTSRTGIDWTKSYAGVSGNLVCVQDGVIQYGIDETGERHPRTAIGFNSSYVFYLVVDGRQQNYSIGMTIDELAEFFKYTLDATWACNQDGGGSSTMVVNGTVMNSPSDGSPRSVSNGMLMCNVLSKSQSTTFSADETVETTGSANVRLGPGTNYGVITSVSSSTEGTVLDHSLKGVYAKGEYWWKVSFPSVTGWVAESLLGGSSCTAPSITQHPSNQSVSEGQTATFTVAADGTTPLSYQWQKDGNNLSDGGDISGATTTTLQIANCESADEGNYRCVVTNACGNATSNAASLTVSTGGGSTVCFTNTDLETFTSGVADDWTASGSSAVYSASTDSYSGNYSQEILWTTSGSFVSALYQQVWVEVGVPYTVSAYFKMSNTDRINGTIRVDYSGGTDPSNVDLIWSSLGTDWVIKTINFTKTEGVDGWATIFFGGYGSNVYANDWCLVDLIAPECTGGPTITQQPAPQNVCAGSTANFSVTATGEGTLTYQWQQDGVDLYDGGNISGATTSALQVSNCQSADEADYRCVVTDNNGSTNSDAAALTLKAATAITSDPSNQQVSAGGTAQFTVTATGAGTITYQWQKDSVDLTDGGDISGATTDTLQIANCESADEGYYRCVVTADCGSDTSNSATLTIAAGATTCHVDSIVMSKERVSAQNYTGRATVTIKNNNGELVANATVTGDFTGDYNETRSGVTNSSGVAVIDTANTAWKPSSFTFCVTNVTHATLTYDSNDNVETCDSY